MSNSMPRLFLARHGETDWSATGRHTGRSDIPLNDAGRARARELGDYLRPYSFQHILTSPLQRAAETCKLAGFGDRARIDTELVEWDYGEYEGKLTVDIVAAHPGWRLFRDGCPGGEQPGDVGRRADAFIARVRAYDGDTLAFASSHIIRVITARWLDLPAQAGAYFECRTASVAVLGYEHGNSGEPVLRAWNAHSEEKP